MYKIYVTTFWTKIPISNLLNIVNWITIDGEPEYILDTFDKAVTVLINMYTDKIYKIPIRGGIEYFLCYVVNSFNDVIAVLNFDGNVLTNIS